MREALRRVRPVLLLLRDVAGRHVPDARRPADIADR